MLLITEPRVPVGADVVHGKERDTLRLSWQERRWTRKRVVTTGGREVALALPTGSVLRPGDIIAVEGDWYLAVEARAEPVLAARPLGRDEAVLIAFEVGNRHFPLAVDAEVLLVPDDPAMEQLFGRLGVIWERREALFDPIGGHGPAHGQAHHLHG